VNTGAPTMSAVARETETTAIPTDFYAAEAERLRTAERVGASAYRLWRNSFALFCACGLAVLAVSAGWKVASAWTALVPFGAAVYAAFRIIPARKQSLRCGRLAGWYETGLARLRYDFDRLDEGAEFLGLDHPYASDLDLFGRGSLFQTMCTARTQAGREKLAGWMKTPAEPEEIRLRQEAVAELRYRETCAKEWRPRAPRRIRTCIPKHFEAGLRSRQFSLRGSPFPHYSCLRYYRRS